MPTELSKPIPQHDGKFSSKYIPSGYGFYMNHGGNVIEYRSMLPDGRDAVFFEGQKQVGNADPTVERKYYPTLNGLRRSNPHMPIPAQPSDRIPTSSQGR